ncbi:MAG: ATP-binding protein [Elusimicrobiota bacterium]|nr:ATP-binding protein [Endomicrobiia bacterium]MDW8165576.1 ATP-binding protein [Elusimicrobiota bacterium]
MNVLEKFNRLKILVLLGTTVLVGVYVKLRSIYSFPSPSWATKSFILFVEIVLTVIVGVILLLVIFHYIRKFLIYLLHKAQEGEENVNEIKYLMEKLSKQTKFLNEKLEENNILNKVIFEMNQTMELEKILKIILESICSYLNFDRALILILNEKEAILEPVYGYNIEKEKLQELFISLKDNEIFLVKILYKNIPVIIKKIPSYVTYRYLKDIKKDNNLICVPLQAKKKTVGLLLADTYKSQRTLTEKDLRLLISFSNQASLAIENAKLFETEKKFKEKLQQEVDLALKKLQEAQKQLIQSEKLAALGEMAAVVSHEVRNPLSTILMSAQVLDEELKDEKYRKYVNYIISEVKRLNKVVSEILTFSRAPKLELKLTNMHKLLDEIISFLEISDFLKYDIKFYKEYNAKISEIMIDPDQIKQVLLNIIQNACHFMANRNIRNLTITTDIMNGMFVLKIKDTGVGIPPENLNKIFDPFFTTKTKGTGLGLTISKNIIESHGGKIEVESVLGEGSSFNIFLPIRFPEIKNEKDSNS